MIRFISGFVAACALWLVVWLIMQGFASFSVGFLVFALGVVVGVIGSLMVYYVNKRGG